MAFPSDAVPSVATRTAESGRNRRRVRAARIPGAQHKSDLFASAWFVTDESAAVVGTATLFGGFEQAFARLQEVERGSQDPARTFIPLFEVLEWTVCIDERLETKTWAHAPHLRGLRWARNRCHHDWAMALEVRRWDEWKLGPHMVREPDAPDEWAWRERLPEARAVPRHWRADERDYERHLAGQPARIALNLIANLFLVELRPDYPN